MASPSEQQRCVVDDSENNRPENENKSVYAISENSNADQSGNDEMAMDTVNIDNVYAEVVIDDATNASTANIDAIIKSSSDESVAVLIVPEEVPSDNILRVVQSSSISLEQVTDKNIKSVPGTSNSASPKSIEKAIQNVKPIMIAMTRSVGSDDANIPTCGQKGKLLCYGYKY